MELKEWKEAIFKTMVANKIDRFDIIYYGGGDEGGVQNVEAHGSDGLLDMNLHKLPKTTVDVKHINNLHDEIVRFAGRIIITSGYEGYEEGNGAEGTVTVNAINRKVTIQHGRMEMVGDPEKEVTL